MPKIVHGIAKIVYVIAKVLMCVVLVGLAISLFVAPLIFGYLKNYEAMWGSFAYGLIGTALIMIINDRLNTKKY